MEIQKEKSEIRRKNLEKRLKMAGKAGGRSGLAKNLKKTKQEQDDEDLLDDLVLETDPDKRQMSYLTLEPGDFMTKGVNRKTRLDQRQARIVAAAGKPNDDGDKEEETQQERLEQEANKLSSQLKQAERAEAQAQDKEERDKAKRYGKCIAEGRYLKQPKAVTLVETRKRKKSMKMENIRRKMNQTIFLKGFICTKRAHIALT